MWSGLGKQTFSQYTFLYELLNRSYNNNEHIMVHEEIKQIRFCCNISYFQVVLVHIDSMCHDLGSIEVLLRYL